MTYAAIGATIVQLLVGGFFARVTWTWKQLAATRDEQLKALDSTVESIRSRELVSREQVQQMLDRNHEIRVKPLDGKITSLYRRHNEVKTELVNNQVQFATLESKVDRLEAGLLDLGGIVRELTAEVRQLRDQVSMQGQSLKGVKAEVGRVTKDVARVQVDATKILELLGVGGV